MSSKFRWIACVCWIFAACSEESKQPTPAALTLPPSACESDASCSSSSRCIDGECVDEDLLCFESRPHGVCPRGFQCIDGACIGAQSVCSKTNPNGVCPSAEHCIEGACLPETLLCSASNTTGLCPPNQMCDAGECKIKPKPDDGQAGAAGASSTGGSSTGGNGTAQGGGSSAGNNGNAGTDAAGGAAGTINAAGGSSNAADGGSGGLGGSGGSGGNGAASGAGTGGAHSGGNAGSAGSAVAGAAGSGNPIRDLPPEAILIVSATTNKAAVLDASGSWDAETADADLQVRWDFEADGAWDTEFSTSRLVTHTFANSGAHAVAVQVKDSAGQLAEARRTATLGDLLFVSGTVNTTTWSGIVVVQGDVTVPLGQTLTIAAGTQVLVVYVAGSGGDGTIGLSIRGDLKIQGTEDAPVLFSVYGAGRRKPKSWDHLELMGTATIEHAVFEYAAEGLNVCTTGEIDVTGARFQLNETGIRVGCSDTTSRFSRITVANNVSDGVIVQNGTNVFQNAIIVQNGGLGIAGQDYLDSLAISTSAVRYNDRGGIACTAGTTSVISSEITDNAASGLNVGRYCKATATQSSLERNQVGVQIEGCGAATVDFCNILYNRFEGALVDGNGGCAISAPIRFNNNNIYDNAASSGGFVEDPKISVNTSQGGLRKSELYTTAHGEPILWMQVQYYESTYGNGSGTVRLADGMAIWSETSSMSGTKRVLLTSFATPSIYGEVTGGSDWPVGMGVYNVFYRRQDFSPQIVLVESGAAVDATQNYWQLETPVNFVGAHMTLDVSNPKSAPVER